MAAKFTNLIILFFSVAISAWSQNTDTLTYAEGSITNAETQQPVSAKITYMSLPYGNIVGMLNGDKFAFPMFNGDKYSIVVEANGYMPAKYMLDPADANDANRLVKNIELVVGSEKKHEAGQVMLLNNLIFQVGKSKISPESYPELDLVVNMMAESDNMVIQLEGHTDYQGDESENMKLSKQRVEAVKDYLVSKGIKSKRIQTKAFGGTMPLSRDNTPEAHRINRRVELRILQN
ncbi:MAG TPA: OmpA family protein [Cyclobacteriaceae bacterium]|nr:OmpA family protein [Cyclobacteriaceae bacterium]